MRVLVACEFSGVVRRAFRERGHEAWSCDLLPAEDGSPYHYQTNIQFLLSTCKHWDLMIAHPPCTHLAVSGARWFKDKQKEQADALDFVRYLMEPYDPSFGGIPKIAIENPVSIISSRIRKPDQIIHPHQFGHPAFKSTCLWLKGLPPLRPTNKLVAPARGTVEHKAWSKVHRAPPGPDRWKFRSRTYAGIAAAMAEQWGSP